MPGAPIYLVPLGTIRKAEGGPENFRTGEGRGRMDPHGRPSRRPRVAVIDTGMTDEQRADGWLSGLVTGDNVDLLNVLPSGRSLPRPGRRARTFVTGVIQQVAPGRRPHMLRGLDTDGLGDEIDIGRQLIEAARRGRQIVNLSLGTDTADGNPPLSLESALRRPSQINPEDPCSSARPGTTPTSARAGRRPSPGCRSSASTSSRWPRSRSTRRTAWARRCRVVLPRRRPCHLFSSGSGRRVHLREGQGDGERLAAAPGHLRHDNAWATWSGTSFAAPADHRSDPR